MLVSKRITSSLYRGQSTTILNNYVRSAPSLSMSLSSEYSRTYFSIGKHDGTKKPKVIILGCGWSSFAFLRKLKSKDFDITLVSPRNHFLFTPLLASSTVGTLEFRSIAEPIRNVNKDVDYIQASCTKVDHENKSIECTSTFHNAPFKLNYDYLVIGVGARNNTFGVPGVEQYSHFLKELHHARSIRQRIIYCFEMASLPDVSQEERRKLLSFVVVGGGPTGVEFAAELNDLVLEDIPRLFPHVPMNDIKITLLEASGRILSAFDSKLVDSAISNFRTSGIEVRTNSLVKQVQEDRVTLRDGTEIPYGLLVWSTGIGPHPFTEQLPFAKDKGGRLIVDKHLRVRFNDQLQQSLDNQPTLSSSSTTTTPTPEPLLSHQYHNNVFSFGDCANIEGEKLPATAQVAQQEGYYLAEQFNSKADNGDYVPPPFEFKFLGILAYVGRRSSLFQTSTIHASGLGAWLAWRSAYLTRLGSLRSKLQVPFDWTRKILFGRDCSSF